MSIVGDPIPGETPSELEIGEFLKQPDNLLDAMYVLLTLADSRPETARNDIRSFFENKQTGQNQEMWQARIKKIKDEHEGRFNKWKQGELEEQHQNFENKGLLTGEKENEVDLYCVHCTDYIPVAQAERPALQTTFQGSDGKWLRTAVHFSLNHTVDSVAAMGGGHSWEKKNFVIIAPFSGLRALNGSPYGMLPEDTWWACGATGHVELPEGTVIIARGGTEQMETLKQMKGIEVIEADIPFDEAAQIMKQRGIRVIYPREFRGAQRLADEWGAFHGYHLGDASGRGSESYLKAEAVIESARDVSVIEYVEKFNAPDYPGNIAERYDLLVSLLASGYFEPPGYDGFLARLENNPNRGEILTGLYGSNPQDSLKPEVVRIYTGLSKLAKDGNLTELPYFSEGMLKRRLDKIRASLDIIPPRLLGAFLIQNQERLGIK